MADYVIKVGFSLRAFAGTVIEADSDAQAIEKARVAAKTVMESTNMPEHIDHGHRDDGAIVFIDRVTSTGTEMVAENLAFEPEGERVDTSASA